ncbi:M16 family metallopeptidase [Pigmentibacter ruber]|uniref:M16 family metallopeptidase n=1 Tax=Pigmentibacter ruber TaxID=2683196 RepID=UPI00131D750A|nr:insulinase family protein [Pigmentibacter ruber]
MFLFLKNTKYYLLSSAAVLLICMSSYAQDLKSQRPVIFSKPIELDWRSYTWPSINYNRTAVDGGGAIYSLQNDTNLKFKVNIVLPGGVFSLPQEDRPAFGALVDLFILGGSGNYSFDEIDNYTSENGINIRTNILANGQLMLSADALTQDFPKVLELLRNILLKPRFDANSLPLWKQRTIDGFKNLIDFNTFDKQFRLIDQQANSVLFGKNHYFAKALERSSPAVIEKISLEKIKELYKLTINKNGLNAFISGNFSNNDFEKLKKLISDLPHLSPQIRTWLPQKDIEADNITKIRTVLITKSDMSQSNISLRYYFPKIGKLNSFESTQFDILEEIFSSSGGIVGNDRFTKALRADSGISYSPHAYFNETTLYPNTNFGMFHLTFQSPNERLAEAVSLATSTWNNFIQNGITQEELDNTRTALINRMLASEITVYNKSDEVMNQILKGNLPSVNPIEFNLAKLDKQKDVQELNRLLKRLKKESVYPVLVIMGNPSSDEIKELKNISDIDLISTNDLNTIIKPYLK